MKQAPTTIDDVLNNGILQDLASPTKVKLKSLLKRVMLEREDILFRNGSPGDGCYFVASGVLRVSIDDHSGGETWLAILGKGNILGEMALIDRIHRSATVAAMTNCLVWHLSNAAFDTVIKDDPQLYHNIAKVVCRRLRITNMQVCDQRLGLEARMANILARLADAFGEEQDDGRLLIKYKIAQSRIAEITGASRENVNRQFKMWRDTGVCDRVGGYYCIQDTAGWHQFDDEPFAAVTG